MLRDVRAVIQRHALSTKYRDQFRLQCGGISYSVPK
jgi:hypothetical protein